MILNCLNCKNDFDCENRKGNYNLKMGFNIYCSSKCYNEYRNKKILFNCATCGKEIFKRESDSKRSKTGNLYCSKRCSTINNNRLFKKWENHPKYKNGRATYRNHKLNSVENPKCQRCDYSNVLALEIHHKDRNRKNNELENLEILCSNCHTIEHRINIENVV